MKHRINIYVLLRFLLGALFIVFGAEKLLIPYQNFQYVIENYQMLVRRQPARALWLGVRLAQKLDDEDALASRALALRNLYPDSAEYQAYEKAVQSGEL